MKSLFHMTLLAALVCTISYGEDWPTRYSISLNRRMPQKIVLADGKEKRVLPVPGEALYYFPATELNRALTSLMTPTTRRF